MVVFRRAPPSWPVMISQATFKGWMDIMYAAVDSREVSWVPRLMKTVVHSPLLPHHRH